jgi:membrane protease YdiL (CAAX protease family)
MQVANFPLGFAWSAVFLFALPPVLAARAANFRAASFLGLRPVPVRLVALGFLVGLGNFPLGSALLALVRSVAPAKLVKAATAPNLFEGAGSLELFGVVLALGLFAPVCEEVVFRGYIQTVLKARYSPLAGVIVAAVLFALLHVDPVGMLARIELGVVFGLLALWSGSLLPAIAAHAANNLVASGLLLYIVGRGTSGSAASSQEPHLALPLAAIGTVGLVFSLLAFRAATRARPAPATALEPLGEATDHDLRLSRIRSGILAWLAAAGLSAAAILFAFRYSAQITWVELSVQPQELQAKLPDEPARQAFLTRLRAERRRAKAGEFTPEQYRARLERVVELGKRDKPPTLSDVEAALGP